MALLIRTQTGSQLRVCECSSTLQVASFLPARADMQTPRPKVIFISSLFLRSLSRHSNCCMCDSQSAHHEDLVPAVQQVEVRFDKTK
jgi:hypothetical protein